MEFYRADNPTIMSGLVVRYIDKNDPYPSLRPIIAAGRQGVSIRGSWDGLSESAIEDIYTLLKHAHAQHEHIKRTDKDSVYHHSEALPFERDPVCVVEYRKSKLFGEPEIIAAREGYTPKEIKDTFLPNRSLESLEIEA